MDQTTLRQPFYGVKTTRIVCRRGCPSRPAKPNNIVAFDDLPQAFAAGYRACKRCKPQETAEARFVELCRLIENAETPPTLEELAAHAGMSPSHLQRRFKAAIGVSPKAYAQTVKRGRLRSALKQASTSTAAIYDAGFTSASQAYDTKRSPLGMTPTQFAAGAQNLRIAYAVVASAIGHVLVAVTERGVCRVDIAGDARILEERLRAEYPRAQLARGEAAAETAASRIVEYVAGRGPWPELPLDVRGTAFQARVWEALRTIRPGTTLSYTQLAQMIGSPRAARAVAAACAANVIALLVPCHRIVPRAGGVGGYRWEPDRKERLLDVERRFSRR